MTFKSIPDSCNMWSADVTELFHDLVKSLFEREQLAPPANIVMIYMMKDDTKVNMEINNNRKEKDKENIRKERNKVQFLCGCVACFQHCH